MPSTSFQLSPAPAEAPAAGSTAPTDEQRRQALRKMKFVATALLAILAVIFALGFALQDRYVWAGYVRAGAEGGMVGALADWFAVTALFRRPMGLPIPHTGLIPRKKDQIGDSLGAFVRDNFLNDEVLEKRLANLRVAQPLGGWIADRDRAERLSGELLTIASGLMEVVADEDFQRVAEGLVREHVIGPVLASGVGVVLGVVVDDRRRVAAVESLIDQAADWLREHPEVVHRLVSDRTPGWLPSRVDRLIGERLHRELVSVLAAARADAAHPLRVSVDGWLASVADGLQRDAVTQARFEGLKVSLASDPRLRQVASDVWVQLKRSVFDAAVSVDAPLRESLTNGLVDLGRRLVGGDPLAEKVDAWAAQAARWAAVRYRGKAVELITDTVRDWDASQATERIELMVGKDLQFIRINGTVVGSLAGVTIFALASVVSSVVG